MSAREPGLRERKRLATRRSIQIAVLHLTAERGLDQVTVDDISRAAGVSPRTFFNYFPTKEASLAGDLPMEFAGDVAERFERAAPDRDPLADLVGIIAEQAEAHGVIDPELHQLRRRVLADYPQIFALRMDRVRAFEADIAASVAVRLRADAVARGESADVDGDTEPDPDIEIAERARLIGMLVFTLARGAWATWMEHPGETSLAELMRAGHDRLCSITVPRANSAGQAALAQSAERFTRNE